MKLVFENATLQDSVGKATRVAPTRGSAFDQSAGILFTLLEGQVSLRATDGLVFYHEVIDAVTVEGDGEWRFPSVLFGAFMAKVGIGSGKQITLESDGSMVSVVTGRTRARFKLIDPTYFPTWEPFDSAELNEISELGTRINMVQWASSGDAPPLSAIHLNGKTIAATNRIVLAVAPCELPELQKSVMIPASGFESILSVLGESRLGIQGGHMLIMPDEHTQIKVITYADVPPPFERIMDKDQPEQIAISRNELMEVIERAMVFGGTRRDPLLTLIIGQEELAVMMNDEEQNGLGDILDVAGSAKHRRVYMEYTPENIVRALRAAPNDQVTLNYYPEKGKPIRIDGGSGYECWIAPRRSTKE